jgi:hypothetical protein
VGTHRARHRPVHGDHGRLISGGPLVLAAGLLWLSAVEPSGSFIVDVLPASLVAALGMSPVALLVASAAAYAAFAAWQRRTQAPLIDPRLLGRRPISASAFVIAVATALMVGAFFLGSFYLQNRQDHGALTTGLLFPPVALSTMACATAAGHVIGRTGARSLAALALTVSAAGFLLPVLWSGTTAMVTGVSIASAGLGALFVVASATALSSAALGRARTPTRYRERRLRLPGRPARCRSGSCAGTACRH